MKRYDHDMVLDLWAEGHSSAAISDRLNMWGPEAVLSMVSRWRQQGDKRAVSRAPKKTWTPPEGVDLTQWQPMDTAPRVTHGPWIQVRNSKGKIRDTYWRGDRWTETGSGFVAVAWRMPDGALSDRSLTPH